MESTPETAHCASCGNMVELPANFCDECGTPLNSSGTPDQPGSIKWQEPVTIANEESIPEYIKGNLYHLNPSDLKTDPNQPRKYFDSIAFKDLVDSIKDNGILQPILFRMADDENLFVVAGEMKFQAAKEAELETIPAIFIEGNYDEITLVESILCEELNEIALVENLLYEDLTTIEFAEALNRIRLEHNYNQEQLKIIIGKYNRIGIKS